MSLGALYGKIKKRHGRAKILSSVIVEILRDKDGQPIEGR